MKKRVETSKIVKRRDEISKIMKDHYHSLGYGFIIEGPFTIEQCKEHLVKREVKRLGINEEKPGQHKELLDRIKRFPDSQKSKDFVRHMGSQEGNELYFFTSDSRSWSDLNGIEGYVIIQNNRIVDILVTFIN
jgi:hypothetical protein